MIGCIDWHSSYTSITGRKEFGWHEHVWDQAACTCDGRRQPQPLMDEVSSVREFLLQSAKAFRIELEGGNGDSNGMLFD